MQRRKSKAASVILSPTPPACWSEPNCIAPTSKTATALPSSSPQSTISFRGCASLFADHAYAGEKLRRALTKFGNWTIEIVPRIADTIGFKLLPRRWVIERTLAWLNRNRRLAKDFEATIASATAWLYLASVQLLIRRMARV